MIETVTLAAKYKALIAAFSLLILGGGLYELADPAEVQSTQGFFTAEEVKDPYVSDLQNRADLVNNAVMGVIDAQGKQEYWKFKQTVENANSFIQKQYQETDQTTTLSQEQREANENFKAYLHEASFVVATCYAGQAPDITKMNELKNKLN